MSTFHYSCEYKQKLKADGRAIHLGFPGPVLLRCISLFLGRLAAIRGPPIPFRSPWCQLFHCWVIESCPPEDIRHSQKNKHDSLTSARNMDSSAARSDTRRPNMAASATLLIRAHFYAIYICRPGRNVIVNKDLCNLNEVHT